MKDQKSRFRKGVIIGLTCAILAPTLAVVVAAGMKLKGYELRANLTPSIPEGIYLSDRNKRDAVRGVYVGFQPHNEAARHAYERGWMKPESIYMKRVGAVAGDTVCADKELTIRTASVGETAQFIRVGAIADSDSQGQPLPRMLSGCTRIPDGYFLPIGDGLPNSYDGRYYGFVPVSLIEATMRPLWTRNHTEQ